MKYLIFFILVLLSCISSGTDSATTGLREVYFDGCQYVLTPDGGITHKGNCSNPAHR